MQRHIWVDDEVGNALRDLFLECLIVESDFVYPDTSRARATSKKTGWTFEPSAKEVEQRTHDVHMDHIRRGLLCQ